jgi:hypothetical protein
LEQRGIRLNTADIKYMKLIAGFTSLEHRMNKDILEEIKV